MSPANYCLTVLRSNVVRDNSNPLVTYVVALSAVYVEHGCALVVVAGILVL
jgi:hypothetical protein